MISRLVETPKILPVMMLCGHYACKCNECIKIESNQSEIECSMCVEQMKKQNLFNEFQDKFENLFKEFKGKHN